MAKENSSKPPTAADKGKGKAIDQSDKAEEIKKDKDGKPIQNGDKSKDPKTGEPKEGENT